MKLALLASLIGAASAFAPASTGGMLIGVFCLGQDATICRKSSDGLGFSL